MQFSLSQIASITQGKLFGHDVSFEKVSTDSREIIGGELFIPLIAERDGHDWISTAIDAGAHAYLTERQPEGGNGVNVASTHTALIEIASFARAQLDAKVIGITGSVGKTTTKDLLFNILNQVYTTHANIKSFNNNIGLPITLIEAPQHTEALILEMGANAPNEIKELCKIGQPDIGVVTCVAKAHTEGFGGIEGVAKAKGELIAALKEDGIAILNKDDHRVARMASMTQARKLFFGEDADISYSLLDIDWELRPLVKIILPDDTIEVRLSLRGEHQCMNAAAAAAIAYCMDIPPSIITKGLSLTASPNQRMNVETLKSGLTLIDDSYNANPESMKAALKALLKAGNNRKIAFLGEMSELGENTLGEHQKILQFARQNDIEVFAIDTDAYGLPSITNDDAVDIVSNLEKNDSILIKASRSAALENLASSIKTKHQ